MGDWRLEIGGWKLEIGGWRLELSSALSSLTRDWPGVILLIGLLRQLIYSGWSARFSLLDRHIWKPEEPALRSPRP